MKTTKPWMETTKPWNVRKMLKQEDPALQTYIKAWRGENPFKTIGEYRMGVLATLLSILIFISTFLATPISEKITQNVGGFFSYMLGTVLILFTSLGSTLMFKAHKELKNFTFAVLWCERHKIPKNLIGGSDWEGADGRTFGADNFATVMGPFVNIIQALILPIEQQIKENACFPKRLAKLQKEKWARRSLLTRNIAVVAKMFNNFEGVTNPLSEAFKLAQHGK